MLMSSPLTCLFLFLQSLPVLCNVDIFHCPLFQKPSVHRDGDLVLDGFFPLFSLKVPPDIKQLSFLLKPKAFSADEWHWKNYQYVLAFLFAIDEINKNTHLLPNLTVGFNIYNAFNSDDKNLENILFWFSGGNQIVPNFNCQKQKKSIAVIAETKPEFFRNSGPLLELYKVPQITYGVFNSLLSNKYQFPSLYQMAIHDRSLVHGVTLLLHHFNWTWVGIFSSEDLQGELFLWELEAEMLKKDICAVAVVKFLPPAMMVLAHKVCIVLWRANANVSVAYGDTDIFITVHLYADICDLSGMIWILIANSYVDLSKIKNILNGFYGSLFFSHQKREIPGFEQFLRTFDPSKHKDFYLIQFWLDMSNCSFSLSICGRHKVCPSNTSLAFMPANTAVLTLSEPSYMIYNVVHTVARALHEMLLGKSGIKSTRDSVQSVHLPWQLHPYLRNIQFTNSIGEHISLDEKRKPKKQYDVLNIMSFPDAAQAFLVKVGQFVYNGTNNPNFIINEDIIEWPAKLEKPPQSLCSQRCGPGFKQIQKGNVNCCFTCELCSKGEVSNNTDTHECILCSNHEYPNQERSNCLPKSVTFFAFEDSLGLALTCTALCCSILTLLVSWVFMKHRHTPIVKANNRVLSYILLASILLCFLCSLLYIGRPNTVTCILQQVTFGVVFTVAVSSVLAKTITVILAFRATKPGRTVRWLLVSGASNSVVPICTLIQVVICGVWLGTSPPFIDIDSHSDPTQLILMCNKGSVTAFYCVLGYLGSLALLSFCLSYQVRNLPDTFNEAKFLTFSMLVFCSIWVTFLPVYHSARGKVMVALEVFSILASSAGLLVCIFAPKCYIILLRPDKNTLKSLRDKINISIHAHS